MTEATHWPLPPVPRETMDKLARYATRVRTENDRQNLVSRGTLEDFWQRHIVDSAQLAVLVENGATKNWCDIGAGAGLPGLVTAIITGAKTSLVEPRRLRAEFLARVATELGLPNVSVVQAKAQAASGRFDVITARAVAKAEDILGITAHIAHKETTFLLMKGRSAQSELDALRRSWQGEFRLVPSVTDAEAGIIVASNVSPRGRG